MVMLPKTFRAPAAKMPFADREGITFGDFKKAVRADLFTGIDPELVIAKVHERFPDEPLLFFKQHYTPKSIFPGTQVVPYQENLPAWLSRRKLFISLVVGETYAMVPIEAQSVGTPVLYRHMPQSLTETIGQSGIMFRDEKDLIDIMEFLLSDEEAWTAYSEAGRHNFHSLQHFKVGMDLALRRVVHKTRRRTNET